MHIAGFRIRPFTAAVFAVFAALLPYRAHADDLLVFAAASLKPALDEIFATPSAQAIGTIKASYAASSQLAHQIEAGADVVQIFDSWAGELPGGLLTEYCIEPIQEIVAGYRLGDKLIRPALVKVATRK